MNVTEIVARWLKDHGCDGLAWNAGPSESTACACEIDNLMECNAPCADCVPAKKAKYMDGYILVPAEPAPDPRDARIAELERLARAVVESATLGEVNTPPTRKSVEALAAWLAKAGK